MKHRLDAGNYIYPMPLALLGCRDCDGRPNFMVVAYVGALSHQPPVISVSLSKGHYTNPCIEDNKVFSLNIPSAELLSAVDFAGAVTGAEVDKSGVFKLFYGDLDVPMAESCPVNLECRLIETREYESNVAYIAEVVSSFADEDVLVEGLPDMSKVDPVMFSMHDFKYYRLGSLIGRAFSFAGEFKAVEGGV